MADMMLEGQRVFIESLREYVKSATNMTGDEAYSFAFRVWQMQEHLRGYLSAGADWISVKDRLPEDGERVLVTECGRVFVERFDRLLGFDTPTTHWMPLPDPPKEESDE